MSKSLFLNLLAVSSIALAQAQNPNLNYKTALKLYNTTTYEAQTKLVPNSNSSALYNVNNTTALQYLQPSIALQWHAKNKNFHELELTKLQLGKEVYNSKLVNDSTNATISADGGALVTTSIALRYEYIFNFIKARQTKLVPSIGLSGNPYFRQTTYQQIVSNDFKSTYSKTGFKAFITPRINYFITNKFFLDVNMPICIFDAVATSDYVGNPILPLANRTKNSFEFGPFPKYISTRIGLGIKI
jgi:hypothetical protein